MANLFQVAKQFILQVSRLQPNSRGEIQVRLEGAAFDDLDNDGDIDLAVVSVGSPLVLLGNTGAAGHWLGVAPRPSTPGTRVTVTRTDGTVAERETIAGSSYLSGEDPRAHFGPYQQQLPGQNHPGLGLLKDVFGMLVAVAEILDMSDRIRQMILERRPSAEIKQAAREEGMTFLRDAALEKAQGLGATRVDFDFTPSGKFHPKVDTSKLEQLLPEPDQAPEGGT